MKYYCRHYLLIATNENSPIDNPFPDFKIFYNLFLTN